MRIIGGTARGRKLRTLSGRSTRPTSEKVREAVFDMLGTDIEGARVLDLFSGSGAMGIEALSRGATNALFVESSRAAREVMAQNLAACGFSGMARIHGGRLPGAITEIAGDDVRFDIVFIDPPYGKGLAGKTLYFLAEKGIISDGGRVVVEHSVREGMSDDVMGLGAWRRKKYGTTAVTIYERGYNGNAD